jgi:phenylpyruvate tautomerase PptA (4-oxalocrotonate tautomerase family)
MPIVRVSLLRGRPPEYLSAVSNAIHETLMDVYGLDPGDKFQMIHQHDPGELIFDQNFGGGPRSNDFMFINITGGIERTVAMKQKFFKRLVHLLQERAGVRPEDVYILLQTVSPSDISFASGRSLLPDES